MIALVLSLRPVDARGFLGRFEHTRRIGPGCRTHHCLQWVKPDDRPAVPACDGERFLGDRQRAVRTVHRFDHGDGRQDPGELGRVTVVAGPLDRALRQRTPQLEIAVPHRDHATP